MERLLCLCLLAISACGSSGPPDSRPETTPKWGLHLDPDSDLDHAQPVLGFVLTSDQGVAPPVEPIVVAGEVSAVSVRRYMDGETSETVLERIRPSVMASKAGQVSIRPAHLLARGERYTLLSREGVLGIITVDPAFELPYLTRVWPPRDSLEPTAQTLYCGLAAPLESERLQLFPGDTEASVAPGLDNEVDSSSRCVRVVPLALAGKRVQPPVLLDGHLIEPSPFEVGVDSSEIVSCVCSLNETSFGPGCIEFDSDRGVVRAPPTTTFWILRSTMGWHSESTEGGAKFSVELGHELNGTVLEAWIFDLSGRSTYAALTIPDQVPIPRVVISEVMANPMGPEPSEEWIEITNAGSASADISGWKLGDESADVDLPEVILEPMAVALLVRRDFVGGQQGDVPPFKGTSLIRVPRLGGNGLANSGEMVKLKDPSGAVISSFPARAERAGVSTARIRLLDPDDAANGFGTHASPGASPGAPNRVE